MQIQNIKEEFPISKNDEIEKLLLYAIQERPVVFDGIVDEDEFYKEDNQRFLFLLKDVNGTICKSNSCGNICICQGSREGARLEWGTFEHIKNEYNATPDILPNGRRFFTFDDCIYLEHWHLSARIGYEKHFERFKETYTELCDKLY